VSRAVRAVLIMTETSPGRCTLKGALSRRVVVGVMGETVPDASRIALADTP
jgi:hypothetical protein